MLARQGNSTGTAALVIALAALTMAVFAVVRHRQVGAVEADTAAINQSFTHLTGLTNGAAKNSLDPRYVDADGDLVADAPGDPAKQLDPATLTFCYVTVDDDPTFKAAFGGLMDAISKATGKPVEYVSYNDRLDKLRDLRDGKLSICGLATGAVPLGVCTAGFVPLVEAADAAGADGSQMKIIVPADSALAKLSDLHGHELTLTEPNSNSGYKAPLVLLRENGMLPPTDYLIRYSQGHVQSIQGIKAKQYEAAAVAGDVLKREESQGRISPGDYKVIYTSDQSFPGAAIGCAYNLKPELVAKIKAAMLGYDWKGTGLEKLFAAEGKVKFIPADYRKNWDYVRGIDERIGFSYVLPDARPSVPSSQPAMGRH